MRRLPGHPIAPPSGGIAECRVVLYEKIGSGEHLCHWCETPLQWMPGAGNTAGALLADHLDWNDQNNDPANLVPSCHICNAHRTRNGDRRRIEEGELTVVRSGRTTRAVERFCVICGTPFIAALSQVKVGRALHCSRSCAGKGRMGR